MSKTDILYRKILLPHLADLRLPGNKLDLNLAEEVLAQHGLRNLRRAQRVMSQMVLGRV